MGQLTELNAEQTECLKNHLALVFVHDIDPSMGDKDKQDKLNAIHSSHHSLNNQVMRC